VQQSHYLEAAPSAYLQAIVTASSGYGGGIFWLYCSRSCGCKVWVWLANEYYITLSIKVCCIIAISPAGEARRVVFPSTQNLLTFCHMRLHMQLLLAESCILH
jgi:hypothetical protein